MDLFGVMDESATSSATKQAQKTTTTTTTTAANKKKQEQQYSTLQPINNDDLIYDIADEEVHFSRNVLNQYQPFTQTTPTTYYLPSSSPAKRTNFTDVNLNLNQAGAQADCAFHDPAQVEQIKSSRLLNSIGNKIRHGSNYLRAPKLVGEYLLGVTIQSWSEFFNTSQMLKAPSNRQQLTRRLLTNLSYFQGNYLCVSFVLIIYCILTSPLLLLAIMAYLVALYLATVRSAHGRHLRLIGYRFNLQQQYSFLTLISVPLLWVAGAPSAVFWVIGASFVVVGLHASMYGGLNDRLQAQTTPNSIAHSDLVGTTGGIQCGAFVNYNQIPTSASVNITDKASVQYYNHYSVNQYSQQQYLPLQSADNAKDSASKGGNLFYSNSLAQWMMFGSSSRTAANSKQQASSRTPDVKIISQDFAGLGRVYEV